MSINKDRELEQEINSIALAYAEKKGLSILEATADLYSLFTKPVLDAIKQSNLEFLSRILEAGPKDMIAHIKNDDQNRHYYRQAGFNAANAQWRATIQAEIEGKTE